MVRRSSRLQSASYYNSTGNQVIFGSTKRKTFLLVLCFGLFFSLAIFTAVMMTRIFTTSSTDVWKQLEELHGEHASLKEKIDFLLPVADRMPNFALESLGARIVQDQTSENYTPCKLEPKSPRILLQGQVPMVPGHCWVFAGSHGQVSIELSAYITISHVSLGHMPQTPSPDPPVSSAPRRFSVFGSQHAKDPLIYLGTFQYEQKGRPLQTFKIAEPSTNSMKYVTLQIHDNWGNSKYSCIYSFRVHGKLAKHEL